MTNENFFKHDNKAYTENLNDAILIANAFDYQVPVNIPGMYNNNHYPNDNNIHKVGVADVTIISSSSLSIGDTSITNNSNTSQVLRLRVYPNFNNFYGWKDLGWDGDDGITIDICDAGTTTSLLPSGELTNPDGNNLAGIASLRGLKEYDLLITIPPNDILNTLSIVFVNNWNSSNRVSASINQSNVTGLESALTGLNEGLDDVETGVSNNLSKINTLSREVWNNTSQTGTSRIDSLVDSVNSLDTSITNIGTFEKVAENTTYELWVNTTTRCARIICHRTNITILNGENFNNYGDFTIPSAYYPKRSVYRLIMRSNQFIFYLYDNGSYGIYNTGSSVSGYNINFQIDYTF